MNSFKQEKQTRICPICKKSARFFCISRNHIIYKCSFCHFGFTENLKAQTQSYYRDQSYIQEEKLFRNIFLKRVKIISRKIKKPGMVLEVGCSTGLMLSLLKGFGWQVKGVEISKEAAEIAKERGIEIITQPFEKLDTKEKYDLIIFNHTLEHLENLDLVLKKVKSLLGPKGFLYIDLPNFDSLSAKILKGKWPLLLPDEHLWHFTQKAITILLSRFDFKVFYINKSSGIWDYNNPLLGLWHSLISFKKRFFTELSTAKGSFIVSKLGIGTDLMVIARKK